MIKLLDGEKENMANQKKIDNIANLWEKTKDPKYKDLWYKYIKEFANGFNTTERWSISSSSSDKRDDKRDKVTE